MSSKTNASQNIPPLAGITVLDLSRLLPGPYATMMLHQMGAQVIKVETPRLGDYARYAPEEFGGDGMFHLLNRGKKSVGLNYRNKRGREIFLELAARADVIFEMFKPGSVSKWGIDYQAVRERNPSVVYCSLSGYGQNGPLRDRAGHDLNYISLAGLLGINGPAGGAPTPPGVQIADLGGGMLAAMSILGALVGRERSGQGTYIDAAMLDLAVSWVMPIAGSWFFARGQSPQTGDLPLSGGWPCYNVYQSADGAYLSLGALENPFWGTFCEEIERPDLLGKQFDSALIPEIAQIFRERTRDEWLELFASKDVCLEPVASVKESLEHPQVIARGLVKGSPETTRRPIMGSLFPFAQSDMGDTAPELGADTQEVLLEAGISQEEIDALNQRGVIKVLT